MDVGNNIPFIYAVVNNRHVEHKESIIEMDGKLCDQVIYILIDSRSNYGDVSPDLVDTCGLSKELHAKSCLV